MIAPPRSIYLDYAAATPLDPDVLEAMMPWLGCHYGNPSSIHARGREARAALDDARDRVAAAIGADYSEIYFTSSGTEADNLAVIGAVSVAAADAGVRKRVVVTAIEHHAVLHAARFLEGLGVEVETLPVDREGRVDPAALQDALRTPAALVSIMHANNEIGVIQDIPRLSLIAHESGALFHTDAVQSQGSLPIRVRDLGCDLLSLSAHKVYGPLGAGALYIRTGTPVAPLIRGGAQEREKRAGTENVPAIVGMGRASEIAEARREGDSARIAHMRDAFIARLREAAEGLVLNGPERPRLPNNVNVSVPGVDGAGLLMALDREGIAASSGAACSSGSIEPSHVLTALGMPPDVAAAGVRFTLGRHTTEAQLSEAAEVFGRLVRRMRP